MAIYNYYKSLYNDDSTSTATVDFFKKAFSKCKNVVWNDSSTYNKITLNSWNKLTNLSFFTNVSGTVSNCGSKYITIIDIEGKECIIIADASLQHISSSRCSVMININGEAFIVNTYIRDIFSLPYGRLCENEKIRITKNILIGGKGDNYNSLDISDYGLYTANTFVNQDSIYTDENGEEYVAINDFLLVKKSMMDE